MRLTASWLNSSRRPNQCALHPVKVLIGYQGLTKLKVVSSRVRGQVLQYHNISYPLAYFLFCRNELKEWFIYFFLPLPSQRRLQAGPRVGRSYTSRGPCLSAASWSALNNSSSLHYIFLALWCGRALQPTSGRRCALFERSEFADRRSRRTAKESRRATPRPTWFWVLLPKQKGLGCRKETPQYCYLYNSLMADWHLHPHPNLLPQGRRNFCTKP